MYALTITLLVATSVISGIGVFSQKYKDNLMQRIGLTVISIGAVSFAYHLWLTDFVHGSIFMYVFGLFLYSLGTVYKIQYFCKRDREYGRRNHQAASPG